MGAPLIAGLASSTKPPGAAFRGDITSQLARLLLVNDSHVLIKDVALPGLPVRRALLSAVPAQVPQEHP